MKLMEEDIVPGTILKALKVPDKLLTVISVEPDSMYPNSIRVYFDHERHSWDWLDDIVADIDRYELVTSNKEVKPLSFDVKGKYCL